MFIKGKKLNISIVFITQSFFKMPKDVKLNSTKFYIQIFIFKFKIYKKQSILQNHILLYNTFLASDNPLKLRKNLLEQIFKIYIYMYIYNRIMTINNQIKDEKIQYDINREAAKISALSSGKIDNYEFVTGEEILPSNQEK